MRLEVQHELAPRYVWIVRILENIGGRLLLRYEGTDRAKDDFWLFYLNHRLHPIGWCKDHDTVYKPPEGMIYNRVLLYMLRGCLPTHKASLLVKVCHNRSPTLVLCF